MIGNAARAFLPPLAAYLLVRIFLLVPGALSGYDTLRPGTWRRWDSGHYLSIARNGYELFPCDSPNYPPGSWCGTAAWLPGYPWLVRFGPRLSVPRETFAVLLSAAFTLALLIILWNGFLDATPNRVNLLSLLLAAFFPGSIYFHAIFPVSMAATFLLLSLWLLREEKWGASGLCGAVASFTYPSGLLLSPIFGGWAIFRSRGQSWVVLLARLSSSTGLGGLGFAFVLLLHQKTVGAWDAFFKVQAKYGHDALHEPTGTFARAVGPFFENVADRNVPGFQTLLVGVLVAAVVFAMLLRRKEVPPFDGCVLATVLLFWAFPFVIGRGESLYRSEALLVPIVILTRYLPWTVQAALVGLFVALELHMAVLFFESVLV
jgi:hypothetical protein